MSRSFCEREAEIIAAMRRGALGVELERHASVCAVCNGVAAASKLLLTEASVPGALPDGDALWWKAQLAGRRSAVERATRSVVLVQRIACCAVGTAALWLFLVPGGLESIPSGLSKHAIWPVGVLGQSALLMGAGALAFAALGSLYFARLEK